MEHSSPETREAAAPTPTLAQRISPAERADAPPDIALRSRVRFLDLNQTWAWCAARGVPLEQEERPAPDPSLVHLARWLYADGVTPGREPSLALASVRAMGEWDECLLWVVAWGASPQVEDWPRYYAARGAEGERRSLAVAPGHLFRYEDAGTAVAFLTLAMENRWEGTLLASAANRVLGVRAVFSHEQWIEVQAAAPVTFRMPSV